MNKRFVKNLTQAVLSSVCYAYAMHMWFPNIPHIVTAIVVAIAVTANIIDFQKDMKRELIVAVISVASVTMFSEIMQIASSDEWWQKENATVLISSIFVAAFESIIQSLDKNDSKAVRIKQIKDIIISISNSIAIYRTISIKIPDVYAVVITCTLALFINVDFDKRKIVKNYQCYLALIMSVISAVTTLFLNYEVFRNVYVAFAIVIPVANVALPKLITILLRIDNDSSNNDSPDKDASSDDEISSDEAFGEGSEEE